MRTPGTLLSTLEISPTRTFKRDIILNDLKENEGNSKKCWKVIRQIILNNKASSNHDIMLKNDGVKSDKDRVVDYINEFFINVGKVTMKTSRILRG